MKELQVFFNSEMIIATLEDRKTQTRRPFDSPVLVNAEVGDLLYVRETWGIPIGMINFQPIFRADYINKFAPLADGEKWKPSIHMPKSLARIWLKVIDVEVENVQDIIARDCIDEGCPDTTREALSHPVMAVSMGSWKTACDWFKKTWDKIYGKKYPWKDNPKVRKITFERFEK